MLLSQLLEHYTEVGLTVTLRLLIVANHNDTFLHSAGIDSVLSFSHLEGSLLYF